MRSVKGARALASGMLVLAAICAVPAMSAAQDTGTPASTTTTTTSTTPSDPALPTDPGGSPGTSPSAGGPGAGTPGEAPDQTRTADAAVADSPPATGPPGGGAAAHKAASASVNMGDFFFSPASVTVAVGDTVTWRNTGEAPHNATGNGGSFSTATVDGGQSTSHTFSSAGTFSYICTIHPQMKGTVRVLSSSGGGGSGGGGGTSSSSGSSESSAVISPDAAGTSTTLPMTGMAAGALALVGLAMLASGLLVRRAGDPKRGWLSLF
jgi:plastocyanin